jgi:spore coat protein U-like protein
MTMAEARDFRLVFGTIGMVGTMALSAPAMAQSTDNLVVQATVGGECSVTGATLDFGSYSGTEKDVDVPISFNCNSPSNVIIQLDGGTTGDPNGRQMFNADNTGNINYQLHQTAARNKIWGGLPIEAQTFNGVTSGNPQVFGRILGSQTPPAGSYTDTVLITLTTN